MEFLIDNWYVIVGIVAVFVIAGFAVYKFAGLPTKTQIIKVKEWLLYAVTVAESALGGGTGKLKLRSVYDMFLTKFPVMAKVVSFETFSSWVDEALDEMKKMLETNENIKNLVNSKVAQ